VVQIEDSLLVEDVVVVEVVDVVEEDLFKKMVMRMQGTHNLLLQNK
jgi:hypothetical protein